LLALLSRIVQARYFSLNTNKKPVFLLDDVLLELDYKVKEKFFCLLPDYEQAFFTFLPGEYLIEKVKSDSIKYSVENGIIK
jgi:DNA replication and repair protein RecF